MRPIVKGTLDLIVLKALGSGPKHGFEITTWIEERSSEPLGFDESAVYHALYRMEKRGLVESTWGTTDNNRQARYYTITAEGTSHLEVETESLVRHADALTALLTGPA